MFTGRFGPGPGPVLFDTVCAENGIRHLLTAPYSPTTTGKVGRLHKTMRAELRALVEHFIARPTALPTEHRASVRVPDSVRAAVAYVAGMTDGFAFTTTQRELGWPTELSREIDVI